MQADDNILMLNGITKTYPGVIALNDVTIHVKRGEVHALVGENGAGKSTTIKVCSGAIEPDSGEIIIDGERFVAMTPKMSETKGIAVIYQEFNLVGELTVAENIFLGRAIRKGIVINNKAMVEESRKIFEQFDIQIDPNELVKNLTVGYQQIVEIAKAISQKAKLLIMDEPSAPLTKTEVEHLYVMVDKLKASGVTVIYISHRMDEIFRLSDRITVMRDGIKVKTVETAETNLDELVKLMVGRALTGSYPSRKPCIEETTLLDVQHLSGNGLSDISFKIKKGEILGFAGLIGAGRTELAELIFGAKKRIAGQVFLNGEEIHSKTPCQAIKSGIALVPEDRKKHGALLALDVKENISIAILKSKLSKLSVVNKKKEHRVADKYVKELRIKTPSINETVKNLSGGNQQKVIIGKWLASDPDLIILDEPTRGIDVGAKYEIYTLINTLVESGKTILMISSEMEEIMGVADRIIVLAEGKITGEIAKKDFSQELIMNYASIN
ncbi:MAG: sugar ABC transporter ATP-binding protein [Spartobacteria bacterium]|nr:sugar ABC transporter ATP-binding protein [Spartobacteria bacterium]